jgi:hypothetical protein
VGNNHMLQGPTLPDLVRVQAPAAGHCDLAEGYVCVTWAIGEEEQQVTRAGGFARGCCSGHSAEARWVIRVRRKE